MEYRSEYHSPVGTLVLTALENALTGLYFPGKYTGSAVMDDDHPVLLQTKEWLGRYFAGENPDPEELTLAPQGTPFRQRVWQILRTIPYGKTMSYGDIAAMFDGKMSAQAVGGAVGHNPISIIIPCHRVIGSDGSLVGFGGGLERKIRLLELEQR